MRILHISVLDKKATYLSRDGDIVCGNSDYVIEFAFDAEWDAHEEKVARFIWNGHYKDVTFTGTTCPVPIITNAAEVEVGVYAGELSTTTPAIISCQKSILCHSTAPGGIPFTKGEKGDPGTTTWIDLEDKPFYETVQNLGDTITWDGSPTEDVVSFPVGDDANIIQLFRISENTPTIEELQTGQVTIKNGNYSQDFNLSDVSMLDILQGLTVVMMNIEDGLPFMFVLRNDNFHYKENGLAIDVEKRGVYAVYLEADADTGYAAQFVSSLTIPNYNFTKTDIKKLDPKFLPDGGVGYSYETSVKDTLTWNGEPSDTVVGVFTAAMHHVSDSVPSIEEMQNCTVVINGIVDGEPVTQQIVPGANDVIPLSDKAFMLVFDGEIPVLGVTTENNCIVEFGSFIVSFPKKGIYFLSAGAGAFPGIDQMYLSSLTIEGYTFTKEVTRKIDEKYLPGILPEVVLTTPLGSDFEGFTEAENAALTKAAATNMPVLIKVNFQSASVSVTTANIMGMYLSGFAEGVLFGFRKSDDGNWYPYMEGIEEVLEGYFVPLWQLSELENRVVGIENTANQNKSDIESLKKSGALPPATASDNGKFLQVVDGAYALVALQDVSKEGM